MTEYERDKDTMMVFVRVMTGRRLDRKNETDEAALTETTSNHDRPRFRLLNGGKILVGVGLVEVARQIRDRWVTISTTTIAAGAAAVTIVYGVLETPLRPGTPGGAGPTAAPLVAAPAPTPEAHTIAPPATSPPAPTATPTTPGPTTAAPDPTPTAMVEIEPTTTATPTDVPVPDVSVTEALTTTPPLSLPTRRRSRPPVPTVTPTALPTDRVDGYGDGTPPPSTESPPQQRHYRCTVRLPLPVCVTLGGGRGGG